MKPSSFQMHKVDVLLEYKELLTQLYQLLNRRFPEYSNIWQKLFTEKRSHIRWVKNLQPKLDAGIISINQNSFKVEAMRFLMQSIQTKMDDLKSNPITFLQGIIFVRDIEDGMVEKNFFTIFQSDSPEFKEKKLKLELEHQNNAKMIKSTISNINNSQR
ncbi:MAG: hypothetical protein KAT34_22360 [Candidatus Aminicenantes bacterium]|nr:hypothetical protein [Candidatus Aminicenantes bacterium]